MSQDNAIANMWWELGLYDVVRGYDQWACINEGRKPWSWASLPGLRRFESETIAIGGSVKRGHVVTCYGPIAEWKTHLVREGLWR